MNFQNGVLFICLQFAIGAAAQSSANAVFDRTVVETGDTFVLRVAVTGARTEPGKVDFSPWRDLLPADNILSRSGWSRTGGRWVSQYTLIAFDSASLQLPPLKIVLHLGDTLRSNALALTVKPTYATADVSEAETIRDIQREPVVWTDYWPWALGVILLSVLITWLLRRKKPKPVVLVQTQAPLPPVIPPHQIALQKLTILEQKQLWKKGVIEPFYAELSLIVREYLEGRFKIPALESTTREILPLLKTVGFPDNLNGVLREILHESDMTKYAQHPPPEQFHAKALDMARQLILATTQSTNL
ncbi:MAG TPA: BatD family protein [Saprospiraceae bacterium]|nr:BatD family protein [Saprospiraceae bacterium]